MNRALSSGGPQLLRWLNASAVIRAVRSTGGARVADLVATTGLTRPTVTQALSTLEQAGWVEMVSVARATAPRLGRPAQQVRFRAEAGHVLGVDIGPHKILAMIADLGGQVVGQIRRDPQASHQGRDLVSELADVVTAAITAAGLGPGSVEAIAVGTPGVVAGNDILLSPSISGWVGAPLGLALAHQFDCPVLIDNDINLAVLGERWQGVAEPVDTLVFVHWGVRLGAGLMIGGRLHRGASAAAGEIGFLDLADTPTRPDPAGLGPLEATIGADAIAALARRTVRRQGSALRKRLRGNDVSPIFVCAAEGDPVALAIVDQIAGRFARGLAPLFLILDPDLVVIGGGVSQGGQVLLDAVERHLGARTLVPPRLTLSRLGDTSVAVGALRLALDAVEERLFSPSALSDAAARPLPVDRGEKR